MARRLEQALQLQRRLGRREGGRNARLEPARAAAVAEQLEAGPGVQQRQAVTAEPGVECPGAPGGPPAGQAARRREVGEGAGAEARAVWRQGEADLGQGGGPRWRARKRALQPTSPDAASP